MLIIYCVLPTLLVWSKKRWVGTCTIPKASKLADKLPAPSVLGKPSRHWCPLNLSSTTIDDGPPLAHWWLIWSLSIIQLSSATPTSQSLWSTEYGGWTLWKIMEWVRQRWWHSQYDGKVIENSTVPKHQPGMSKHHLRKIPTVFRPSSGLDCGVPSLASLLGAQDPRAVPPKVDLKADGNFWEVDFFSHIWTIIDNNNSHIWQYKLKFHIWTIINIWLDLVLKTIPWFFLRATPVLATFQSFRQEKAQWDPFFPRAGWFWPTRLRRTAWIPLESLSPPHLHLLELDKSMSHELDMRVAMYVAMYVARFCTHSFSFYFPDSALNMHLIVLRICSYTSYKPLPWYFLKQGIRRYSICECFGGCHFATFTHHIHPSPQSFYGHLPFTETQVGGLHKPPLSEHGSPMLHDLHNKWPCQPEVGICIVFAPQTSEKPAKIIGTIWIISVFMGIYPTRPAGEKKAFSPTFMRCTASHAVSRWFLLNFPPDTGKPPLLRGFPIVSHDFQLIFRCFHGVMMCHEWLAFLMCSARPKRLIKTY